LDFDWGTLLPVGGSIAEPYRSFPRDHFSVRFTGQVVPAFSEIYTFKLLAGGLNAAGKTVTITASDAEIGSTVTGATITVINASPAANPLNLGDGAPGGGFGLSQAEINFLNAATVVLDAGTTGTLTRQDVAIGGLALDPAVGTTRLDVLGVQRIDVTGAISGSGSRTLRLGGNAAVSELASVIRVAAEAAGGGGRILLSGGSLELNGKAIGVGQDAGFLADLGLKAGGTPLAKELVASQYIGNANSSLYSSIIGGAPYAPPPQVLVQATKLSVRFNDYALFQNTGTAGTTSGAVIGTTTVD
jgi:hypothetical protein